MGKSVSKLLGVNLLLLGVVGSVLVAQSPLLGLLNIDILENIVHLATGAAFAYVGFAMRDNGGARMIVRVLGIVYVAVGVIGFVAPTLLDLLQHPYTIVDNVIHLTVGAIVLYFGFMTAKTDLAST